MRPVRVCEEVLYCRRQTPENIYNSCISLIEPEAQKKLSNLIFSRKNVIVSAPTSFGKSLLIEEIIANDKDAVIYCEGCITKVWDYDVKIYLQVDDDVLTQNLINRRRTAIAQGKTRYKELTQEEIDHKLDIFIRHDVAAKNKKYEILPHNTEEQRESNFKYLLNLSK